MADDISNFYYDDDFNTDPRGGSGIGPNIPIIDSYLTEAVYPASKEELIDTAKEAEADKTTLGVLRNLPDEKYISEQDVNEVIFEQEDSDT